MPRLCVLGSGSGGNGSWISLPSRDGTIECLIDAGLSPKTTGERLRTRGLLPVAPRVLVLTHADSDHWRPTWAAHVERLGLRVLARQEHHAALIASGMPQARLEVLDPRGPVELAPGVTLAALRTPHDDDGSTALRFESRAGRVAWLTDLGRAEPDLIEFARGCEIVAIESNYCPELQMASRRPLFLKQRIMGGNGHLSNDQCIDAVKAIVSRSMTGPHRCESGSQTIPASPHRIVLLHLSRECNDPARIHRLWQVRLPHLVDRLVVSSQACPTPVLALDRSRPAVTHPLAR